MNNAIEFRLGYNTGPMVKSGQEAVQLNKKFMKQIEGDSSAAASAMSRFTSLLGGGAFLAGARSITSMAGEISDLSSSIGLGAEQFQRFGFAIEQSGGKQTDFVRAMGTLIQKGEEAKSGNEKTLASFQALGITLSDLQRLSADQVLLRLADALKASGGDAATTAEVMDLLGGKVALKLIPALKEGSAEFLNVGESARAMSDSATASIDRMGDALGRWKKNLLGIVANNFDPEMWKGLFGTGISTPSVKNPELEAKHAALNPPPAAPSLVDRMTSQQAPEFMPDVSVATVEAKKLLAISGEIAAINGRTAQIELESSRAGMNGLELLVSLEKERNELANQALKTEFSMYAVDQKRTAELKQQIAAINARIAIANRDFQKGRATENVFGPTAPATASPQFGPTREDFAPFMPGGAKTMEGANYMMGLSTASRGVTDLSGKNRGLNSGGLGVGASHAYGLVRRGDADRGKEKQKSAEQAELEKLNQKMSDYWGGK